MPQLSSFTFISLNGLYKGPKEDTAWHVHGEEEAKFSEESLYAEHTLVFGRKTYEMMKSFWPTPVAADLYPEVARQMNEAKKIVISSTLKKASWKNTSIMSGDPVAKMKKLKASEGPDMTILGSGSIVTLFAANGLIDEFSIMIDPVALGKGTMLFKDLKVNLELELKSTRVFKSSGVVVLNYKRK